MKTYLECIECFFKQVVRSAKLCGLSKRKTKELIDEVARTIPHFSLTSSPPEMGRVIYKKIRLISGKNDPFKRLKELSNRSALKMYPKLKKKVMASHDRLLTAVELAIAGNVIDYGAKSSLDLNSEIQKILKLDFKKDKAKFNYRWFKKDIRVAEKILYIGDNSGEIVFDRILIEELVRLGKEVTFATRDEPVINDVLIEDAYFCKIDRYADIISSGSDAPGTILKSCNKKFKRLFHESDIIISKGQGNYETLSEQTKLIYFLFKIKCPTIAREVGYPLGNLMLIRNKRFRPNGRTPPFIRGNIGKNCN